MSRRPPFPIRRIAVPLLLAGAVAVACSFWVTRFQAYSATLARPTGAVEDASLPIRLTGEQSGLFIARFLIRGGPLHPLQFTVQPDDCLISLHVDGRSVVRDLLPYCDYAHPISVRLPHLSPGAHGVEARIQNDGGDAMFTFEPSPSDPAVVVPRVLLAVLAAAAVALLLWRAKAAAWAWQSALLLGTGIVLRVLYLLRTPYWVRGHDTDGHIEYIRHLVENLALPAPDAGWESWQPPLYYGIGALWWSASAAVGLAEQPILESLQWMALILSVATLLLAFMLGLRIVKDRSAMPVWLLTFCFLPSMIFLSARINNDVLVVPLTFLSILLLVLWRRAPSLGLWTAAAVVAGLATLTKNTALLLVPIACCFLVIHRWKRFWHPVSHAVLFVGVMALTAGWFSAYRIMAKTDQQFLIGNSGTLNSGLAVGTQPETYLTFNPVAMMQRPYNNAWSEEERRSNFLEYLYRSAFFGEFSFGPERKLVASALVGMGLLVLAVAIAGAATALRRPSERHEALLWLMVAGVLLFGHMAFRAKYPFSSSQDFRYSLPLLIPLAYFTTKAREHAKNPAWAGAIGVILTVTAALSIIFTASL